MYRLNRLASFAAVSALAALGACKGGADVLIPASSGTIFGSYVAIGNSITAGYQSGGINDSTQRQSFALLLAKQMGTQYHYASLAGRGCTPPIANTQTGALSGAGSIASTCDFRAGTSITDVLNNVAVPGARVLDPTSASTVASNALTTFILGGKSQVQKALEAKPTFATIWIGNNDVLSAGASGVLVPVAGVSPGIVSTQAVFQQNYDLMIKQLLDSMPNLKGVLIGVVQVAGIPLLSSGDTIFNMSATNRALLNAATGKTVAIDGSCAGSTSLVNLPSLISAIRAGSHPAIIVCKTGVFPAPIGDFFVLDATEQTTLTAAVNAYNSYISAKAASIGFAYLDPNPILAGQRATNAIPRFPNFASATATFGSFISLDGVHPAAAEHVVIANELIKVINAKYSTTLAAVQ